MPPSAPRDRFQNVFGDRVSELSRRLATAERAAEQAREDAKVANDEAKAATRTMWHAQQRADAAEQRAAESEQQAEREREKAAKAASMRRQATSANYQLSKELDALRGPQAPDIIDGQMRLTDDAGNFQTEPMVLVVYHTERGNERSCDIPATVFDELVAYAAALQDTSAELIRSRERAVVKACAAAGISKTRTSRLIAAARSGLLDRAIRY